MPAVCWGRIISISAGKYWMAAVSAGDVYMWDGKKRKDGTPIAIRLPGVKKATSVSVGETHLLIVSPLFHPCSINNPQKVKQKVRNELDLLEGGFVDDYLESNEDLSTVQKKYMVSNNVPSLKTLCEKAAMAHLVERRNAIQLLEIADSLGADDLRKHCKEIVIRNLDYILRVSTHNFASTSLDILLDLEKLLDLKSSEPWSYRHLPTPTATFPAIVNSEEEDSENEFVRTHDSCMKSPSSKKDFVLRLDNFLQPNDIAKEDISKQVRVWKKKLQQIEMLEEKLAKGCALDDQQIRKLQTRSALESSLAELGVPIETVQTKSSSSVSVDGKGSKKGLSKKQRRKSKHKVAELEEVACNCEITYQSDPPSSILDLETSPLKHKGASTDLGPAMEKPVSGDSATSIKKDAVDIEKAKTLSSAPSKKKNKKGGLSVFLSGALDDVPKIAVPPPLVPRSEGPAWGGATISKGSTSLREIQDEQSRRKEIKHTKGKNLPEEVSGGNSNTKFRLCSFFPSNPIPMVSPRTSQVYDTERNTPPWAASPPSLTRPSFRDVLQQ